MKSGIGTGCGIGIGRALVIEDVCCEVEARIIDNAAAEWDRYCGARIAFIQRTQLLIDGFLNKVDANSCKILENHLILVQDSELNQQVRDSIYQHYICAEAAFDRACRMFIDIFNAMEEEMFRQRASDIDDVRKSVLRILMGIKDVDISNLEPDTVLVIDELPPSVTAIMDSEHISGIVTSVGGATSHAAILSKALGIPAVLSVKNIHGAIKNNDLIIVDGEYGEVFINPSDKTLAIYHRKRQQYQEKNRLLGEYTDKQTLTADNRKLILAANIGTPAEAIRAMEVGAEGVGLFRTEFLFMNGQSLPDEEEQFQAYKQVALICREQGVIIRTLDVGGDKDVPYMGLTKEVNPFLGYRGIRYCLDRVDVFARQIRAILRASAYGRIKVMLPMITSVNEVRTFKKHIRFIMDELDSHSIPYDKNIQIGVMIETPAAAVIADLLAEEVDFFSIGTNDLIQYTIAVDRGNEMVSYLYTPLHPAVIRLIKKVIEGAKSKGIPVGMCGEAASDPRLLPMLIAFGLDEFSVSVTSVLETRKNIALWSIKEAQQVADKVLGMESEFEISEYLNRVIKDKEL